MTDNTTNDETTTWTEQREQAEIRGEKRPIPDGTLNEAHKRREGQ
ncbi:hypothetical protein [Halobacterium sp. KA-6]|nr:hypothetical protein [Halobacterium sp. KA-6]